MKTHLTPLIIKRKLKIINMFWNIINKITIYYNKILNTLVLEENSVY